MPKMVHFGEFLITWSLRSNSATRQVNFKRSKIDGKCQNSNATFGVIFKHCAQWKSLRNIHFLDSSPASRSSLGLSFLFHHNSIYVHYCNVGLCFETQKRHFGLEVLNHGRVLQLLIKVWMQPGEYFRFEGTHRRRRLCIILYNIDNNCSEQV